jgi:hypothetical protein
MRTGNGEGRARPTVQHPAAALMVKNSCAWSPPRRIPPKVMLQSAVERAQRGTLVALGCRVVEGPGSAVTVEHQGRKANFHRPHPEREALRYRVKAVREYLTKIGAIP